MSDIGDERRYAIWGFVALFVLLAVGGLLLLLTAGDSTGPTSQLPTPTVAGDGAAPTEGTRIADDLLPEGAVGATVDGDTTTYAMATGRHFDGIDPADIAATTAPVLVSPVDDGATLRLSVGCATSSQERVAQVTVAETADSVTVRASAIALPGAPRCDDDSVPTVIEVPLAERLGSRSVLAVPGGTEISPPQG